MEQVVRDLVALTGFSAQDSQILRENAAHLQQWTDELTKVFYDTLYAYPRTAQVFVDGERPHREITLHDWYLEVISGQIKPEFWQRQWFVGLMHIKRGVDNQFLFGILSRVQLFFMDKCYQDFDPVKATRVFVAFKRMTDVIAGLIVESYRQQYLHAVERASGINQALIHRMAVVETVRMIVEIRGEEQGSSS
ncbi:MAG: protoglobin domain-containing protein [Chloroflexota bacterium]|nr:hypothetical protein [Chloroflexota bacterium]